MTLTLLTGIVLSFAQPVLCSPPVVFLSYGDSKTVMAAGAGYNADIWQPKLVKGVAGRGCPVWSYDHVGTPTGTGYLARGNKTVAEMEATIVADLAATYGTPSRILLNVGVKEMATGLPAEADWEEDLGIIVDAMHTKWPSATLYIMTPWRRDYPEQVADVAAWIDVVQSTRAAWLLDGPDERVWMEGGDDGATMTSDGIHYSAAGVREVVTRWRETLGI